MNFIFLFIFILLIIVAVGFFNAIYSKNHMVIVAFFGFVMLLLVGVVGAYLTLAPSSTHETPGTMHTRQITKEEKASDSHATPPVGSRGRKPPIKRGKVKPRSPEPKDESSSHDDVTPHSGTKTKTETPTAKSEKSSTTTTATTPEALPDWINNTPEVDADGIRYVVVDAGFYTSQLECQKKLQGNNGKIAFAVRNYIYEVIREEGWSNRFWRSAYLSDEEIARKIVDHSTPPHVQKRTSTITGPMYKKYVLLRFTPELEREILAKVKKNAVKRRIEYTIFGGCLVLALIGTGFGYFKLDSISKGFYTRRLQIVAAVMILVIFGLFFGLIAEYPHRLL